MVDISKNIKFYRKRKGLNQSQLASQIGVKQGTIANYERGTRTPTIEILLQISEVLGISITGLISEEIEESKEQEVSKEELCKYILESLIQKKEYEVFKAIQKIYEKKMDILYIFEEIIVPVMKEVGILWEKGELSIADEHAATEVMIRIVDYLAINITAQNAEDAFFVKGTKEKKVVVCMTVSPESHTLGLKMVATYLSLQGYHTIFLGNNVPTPDLVELLKERKADYLFLSLTMARYADATNNLIQVLQQDKRLHKLKIIVGGKGIENIRKETIDSLFYNLYDVEKWVRKIRSS